MKKVILFSLAITLANVSFAAYMPQPAQAAQTPLEECLKRARNGAEQRRCIFKHT